MEAACPSPAGLTLPANRTGEVLAVGTDTPPPASVADKENAEPARSCEPRKMAKHRWLKPAQTSSPAPSCEFSRGGARLREAQERI